ncbi:MAG: RNA pseudouridine synthase, partial [Bacteroidales bacterium]
IHRIDRPVSGLVLLAKTSKALARLNEIFRNGEIKKTYLAIVKNKPDNQEAHLTHYLRRNTKTNKTIVSSVEKPDWKKAELYYEHIASSDNYHLLSIVLKTGRHHQIRAQLSFIGLPIRGDLKYGAERSNPEGGIDLHSYKMEFIHPVKNERIEIKAPIPDTTLWKSFIFENF